LKRCSLNRLVNCFTPSSAAASVFSPSRWGRLRALYLTTLSSDRPDSAAFMQLLTELKELHLLGRAEFLPALSEYEGLAASTRHLRLAALSVALGRPALKIADLEMDLSNLRALVFFGSIAPGQAVHALPRLLSLQLASSPQELAKSLQAVAPCANLQTLVIECKPAGKGLDASPLALCRELKRLEVAGCTLSGKDLANVRAGVCAEGMRWRETRTERVRACVRGEGEYRNELFFFLKS
jgi:hypothetical protein